jgi:hypothetical protein
VNEYKWYFRALETRDEYFEYYRKRHAFWRIYGFQLPDDVLKKIYYENALKLVPGLDKQWRAASGGLPNVLRPNNWLNDIHGHSGPN